MEERSDISTSASRGNKKSSSASSRKSNNKKRNGRRIASNIENWCEEAHPLNENGGGLSTMNYRQILWQQQTGLPPHLQTHVQPHGGQRLFAAMSEPSVRGYSAIPMAYAVEPVSVPPIYPLYQPISRLNYRTFRGRPRRSTAENVNSIPKACSTLTNGYSSLRENRSDYLHPTSYQNGDYASLPPNANNDRSDNREHLNSEHRRYSDPGLGPADSNRPTNSEDSDSSESAASIITIGKNNKFVLSLVEQMTALRETNSQMFKELHETRADLECMKSELAKLKRGGTSDYQPGMLSDIVREMREANKVLDEAMITKVNAMVDEQNRQRTMEYEKLRDQLSKITEEKDDSYRRIAKLEDTVAALRLNVNNEDREIAAFEEETLVLRRELQEARASRNMAENHVAKCVSGLSRPITPVTFDTPCITSTPVRTELHNPYRSLSRNGSVNDDFSEITTNLESTDESHSRRRDSTNSLLQPDENLYRLSPSSTSSSTSSSPSSSSRCDDRAEIDEEWRWRGGTSPKNTIFISNRQEERTNGLVISNISVEKDSGNSRNHDVTRRNEFVNTRVTKYTDKLTKLTENCDEIENNERLIVVSKGDNNISRDEANNCSKKLIEPKVKRTYRVSDKVCTFSNGTSKDFVDDSLENRNEIPDVIDETCNNETKDDINSVMIRDAVKNCRKRTITEVPDVIVIAGKPVVPKDLCSTRFLTSSVLTRATYTTAYI